MRYYIGIDGGGTKTKFTLANENGKVLTSTTKATIHYLQCGLEGLSERVQEGVGTCLKNTDLNITDIAHIFVGCPGYGDIVRDTPRIEKAIQIALQTIPHSIGNDTDNALAGALAGEIGICVIAGTGSIGLGIDDHGKRFTSGGWHHAFGGDEGSAHWIACRYIQEYSKQSDGRRPKTELYHSMNRNHAFEDDTDMLNYVANVLAFDRTQIAAMAEELSPLARYNDAPALEIYRDAAYELGEIVTAIYTNLHYVETTKVSYAGGVFKSGSSILTPFKESLMDIDCEVVEPIFEPSIGSVILALKNDGIAVTDAIIDTLKTTQD
ncbi:ATPase [Erysipelothrix sp. HDW6C]|uniref:BadF/BadG/BcrA/BcrD ATPase family protein n=1 Tax=Erysipelothrix sp. HDW6C TaxID=2714930 RepID=UPI00140A6EBE|nr:BadF/BadG/BcrA/BcrD ATPase family protein [Erysipelothrix sp. HDW6C]QIK69410.1 ATPase [Erysipelothrix sp. HDW6C]